MTDTQTILNNVLSDNEEKKYTFDYSFWSFDGYKTDDTGYCLADGSSQGYKDQEYVFEKIGKDVLANAWNGFHTCLFAYGQTGAGKSYSMIGYGTNKGIVPLACADIFKQIGENKETTRTFEV